MHKKLLFIYNPRSGKAKIKNKLSDIVEIFERSGYEVTIRPTGKTLDATVFIQEAEDIYDLVVCSGGDGTLDEVVTGMMSRGLNIPIGYIQAGSTNDFGGSLQLPKNMIHAAEAIVTGKDFPCDVGSFNDDFFIYIAAFGLFTEVSYETDQDMKNVLGHMAYILEGVKRLPSIRSYPLKITYEDTIIEEEFIFGMITNSISVGGFKRITGKHVVLDDGVFEVTLIKKPKNAIELNKLMASLIDRNIDAESMYCFRTDTITFESEEPLAWTLDGEFGGDHTEVSIKNNHKAITMRIRK